MKTFTILVMGIATLCCHGQTQPNPNHLRTLFVGGVKPNFSAVPIYAGGPAPFMLGSVGSSTADINMYFRRRCHVAVTTATPAAADFVLTPSEPGKKKGNALFSVTPNTHTWILKNKTGETVFTTSAWREVNTAKDVCGYFKAHP